MSLAVRYTELSEAKRSTRRAEQLRGCLARSRFSLLQALTKEWMIIICREAILHENKFSAKEGNVFFGFCF